MPLVVADRVRETTTTTGTGTITLAGAVTGYQSFSAIGNGNTTYYTINAGSQWEVGIGTYTGAGPSLARDTVLESSNSGSLVDFAAGTKDVFVTYPAEKSISDGYGLLPVPNGGTGVATLTGVVIGNGTSAFTVKTNPTGAFVGTTDTQTLTDKRVTPRVNAQTTTASPWAWNSDSYDQQSFSALANALTINADAGTPTDGQRTILRFEDNGTARALTWTTGATKAFRAVGVTLPTTTVVGKVTYVGCIYNVADLRWDAVAVSQEA